MGRRRSTLEISMFPFLSVLCAVIGVLVLFIVLVLSTRVVEQEELFRRTEAYDRRPTPGQPDALEEGIDPAVYEQLEQQLAALQTALVQREQARREVADRLAGLEDLIDFKKTQQLVPVARRGQEMDKPEPVVVLPQQPAGPRDGANVNLRPVLLEVSLHGYTVHPSRETFPPIQVNAEAEGDAALIVAPELRRFLQDLDRRRGREYLVMLIHPNGVEAFDNLNRLLFTSFAELRVGWEPFSREWIVVNE